MPVPGFISSFADKAQSAIAEHLPSGHRSDSTQINSASTLGKNPTFEVLQHQLRSLGQQYGTGATPVQKIITSAKGVAIDLDSLSRDQKAQSKELYTWGQGEEEDLKDVSDRLAYLNFVSGSLVSSLAVKLDSARSPLKLLRDAENAILPRRNIRAGLHQQLARLEHDNQKGMEKRIADLKEQIRKAEADDSPQEKEIELLKRKGLRETAQPVISALPTLPPSPESPYTGAQATGAARASLQRALDNYKTGHINLPPHSSGSDLSRSDTRSFGESHASELSSITSSETTTQSNVPFTPPLSGIKTSPPTVVTDSTVIPAKSQSPPIDPSTLNLSPAPIPASATSSNSLPPSSFSSPSLSTSPIPIAVPHPMSATSTSQITDSPTMAETGVPLIASEHGGPGPASGSLRDIKAASATAGPRSGGLPADTSSPPASFGDVGASMTSTGNKWESADEEKKRLAAQYSTVRLDGTSGSGSGGTTDTTGVTPTAPKYETAEEEKKRLERERREELLKSETEAGAGAGEGGSGSGVERSNSKKENDDDELPPYQPM
ncbi:hypothetical protein BDP27DRAFT_1421299 [Rhodocollybia butyracea]|uniref:Uncharacterized protein n=1 Tax=Rhodocollybia butyracea TaxID=206335 RepID=A0A9P5PV72_9AGAR|nr:hypothetical protein BDP27DRAFT_1421299 [Rhodocollybia butyracea]